MRSNQRNNNPRVMKGMKNTFSNRLMLCDKSKVINRREKQPTLNFLRIQKSWINKSYINSKFDLLKIKKYSKFRWKQKKITFLRILNYNKLQRSRFQAQRFLDHHIFQLPKILKLKPKWRVFKNNALKLTLGEVKSYCSRGRKLSCKKLTSSRIHNIDFVYDFWLKYKNICVSQDILALKKRWKNWLKKYKNVMAFRKRRFLAPVNSRYQRYKKSKYPKSFFKLNFRLYKKYPWLNALVFSRKIYRLTRKSTFKRLRNPWNEKKQQFYRWWLKAINNKKQLARKKHFRGDQLYRKYIFLTFFGNFRPKQFKTMVMKFKGTHKFSETNYVRAQFENRLDVLSFNLNMAPTIFWARHLADQNFISVSNQHRPSLRIDNWVTNIKSVSFPSVNLFGLKFFKQIEWAKKINFTLNTGEKQLNSELWTKWNNLTFNEWRYNKKAMVNKGEIIHISPFFKKNLSFFFMNRLRKKLLPKHFKINSDRTAALMIRNLKHEDFSKNYRIKNIEWNAIVLYNRK